MKTENIEKVLRISIWIFTIVFTIWNLMWMIKANLDFSKHEVALYMDELITFTEVSNILNKKTLFEKIVFAIDGSEYRYGRVMFYLDALGAYLPHKYWGNQGLIISLRMQHAIVQLAGFLLLTFAVLKNTNFRLVTWNFLLIVPFAQYYSTLPKPETYQIFFLGLFFYIINRKKEFLRMSIAWLFLGLAFASKISALPVLFFLGTLLAFGLIYSDLNIQKKFKIFACNSFLTVSGWAIGIPIFIVGLLFFIKGVPFVLIANHLKKYFLSTFLNTGHGADNNNINFIDWLSYVFNSYFSSALSIIFFSFLIVCSFILLIELIKNQDKSSPYHKLLFDKSFIMFTSGLIFILPVIFLVKRIWGMYLHVGTILCFIGSLGLIANSKFITRNKSMIYPALLSAVCLISILENNYVVNVYESLSLRSNSSSHKHQLKVHNTIQKLVNEDYSNSGNKSRAVFIDPNIYVPLDSKTSIYYKFYGPFLHWKDKKDFIFITEGTFQSKPKSDNVLFDATMKAKKMYVDFVKKKKSQCITDPCYYEIQSDNMPNIRTFKKF